MVDRSEVPGYIPPGVQEAEIARKIEQARREADLEIVRLRAELDAKIRLAQTSKAPRNCKIEVMGGHIKGNVGFLAELVEMMLPDPKGPVEIFSAWHLGGWTHRAGNEGYVGSETNHQFAISSDGSMYKNSAGVGDRKEFMIGTMPDPSGLHDMQLGGPFDPNTVRDLPGLKELVERLRWSVLEVPKPEEAINE